MHERTNKHMTSFNQYSFLFLSRYIVPTGRRRHRRLLAHPADNGLSAAESAENLLTLDQFYNGSPEWKFARGRSLSTDISPPPREWTRRTRRLSSLRTLLVETARRIFLVLMCFREYKVRS
jgi:hypothetical protein